MGEHDLQAYLCHPWSRGYETEARRPGKLCPGEEEVKVTSSFPLGKACHLSSKGNAA